MTVIASTSHLTFDSWYTRKFHRNDSELLNFKWVIGVIYLCVSVGLKIKNKNRVNVLNCIYVGFT